jgi:pimeloyl-ACP methyl ester carboxylesterase
VPIADLNEIELYYEITGSGEPLVLVHGSWGDHNAWRFVVPALADTFQVLSYDRRGHSKSERPSGQGSIHEDVTDLAALVEHLGLAPAHIVGTSFGGSIALRLAGGRPEVFRSLSVHEPLLFGVLEQADWHVTLGEYSESAKSILEKLRLGDWDRGARQFMEEIALGFGGWDRLPEEARRTFTHNAPTWLDEQSDPDWDKIDLESLADFPQPVLLTRGDPTKIYFPPVVEELSRTLPHAEQQVIRGASHVPHITHPAEYAETIAAFVARVR